MELVSQSVSQSYKNLEKIRNIQKNLEKLHLVDFWSCFGTFKKAPSSTLRIIS